MAASDAAAALQASACPLSRSPRGPTPVAEAAVLIGAERRGPPCAPRSHPADPGRAGPRSLQGLFGHEDPASVFSEGRWPEGCRCVGIAGDGAERPLGEAARGMPSRLLRGPPRGLPVRGHVTPASSLPGRHRATSSRS